MALAESRTDADLEPVVFRTDGDWQAADVVAFMTGMEDLYGAFVLLFDTVAVRDRTTHQKISLAESLLGTDVVAPAALSILDDGYLSDYVQARVDQVFEWIPESRLRIVSIEMSSPGMISLAGLGEPIRQLRELIKDLWYRNKQEQQAGELEILRQWLAIEGEFGPLPPAVSDRVAPKALRGIRTLEQLESAGKVVEVPSALAG